jgi:hypothetical protein
MELQGVEERFGEACILLLSRWITSISVMKIPRAADTT